MGAGLILVVEDREDDILLMEYAFEKVGVTNSIQYVRSGEEAIAYLAGEGPFSNRSIYALPSLVLLDLELPGMDGFQVLSWIRHQQQFRALPVVALSSSSQIRDVNRACFLGANSYYVKEGDFEQIVAQSSILHKYWASKTPARKSLPRHQKLLSSFWETARAFVTTK